jgi:hypothetical protein
MFGKSRASATFPLDPFGFWPGTRSRVAGLGGEEEPVDPTTVFHTLYTAYDPGSLMVDIQFEELEATHGTLTLDILALPEAGEPVLQSKVAVSFADLVAGSGRYRLPVAVKRNRTYALRGRVFGESDARAAALELRTDQRADGPEFARRLAAVKNKVFGVRADRSGLVVDVPATLAEPRSQMCTAAQFDEPDYHRWLAIMHQSPHRHRKQWEHVWICRVLEHLGCLTDGARGLGFGCGIEPLPAVFAAHGAFVTATDLAGEDRRAKLWQDTSQHLLSAEALNDPAICPPERFFERVGVDAIDMNAIPADRVGYDFCWSSCALEHLGSIDAGLAFIERSLGTLRPGGVAVHTTELNLMSDTRTLKKGDTVLFRRSDLEKFARRMAARGHHVLPITWDQGDQPEDQHVDVPPYAADIHFKLAVRSYVTTSFGLAIRKAA